MEIEWWPRLFISEGRNKRDLRIQKGSRMRNGSYKYQRELYMEGYFEDQQPGQGD